MPSAKTREMFARYSNEVQLESPPYGQGSHMPRTAAVLILEDDAGTRHLLEALVRRNQCRAVLTGDGEAALQSLQETDFDVILLDLLLPKLDGRDLLRHLALAMPQVLRRIIVIT